MSTTLPLFWNLSSASKKDRVDASVKLISSLEQFQSLHVPQDVAEGSDHDEPEDGLDALNAPDVSYSIRRLVRGLASPRESSRLGFSVALTELLSRIDTVTCPQVISLISSTTKKHGSMTGQEERDVLFARLFGLTAVIQSGLLVRTQPLPRSTSANTPVSSLESYQAVLSHLLAIGEAKSWLRESAWWTIGLAIDVVHKSSVPWKVDALNSTIESIFSQAKEALWSPEKVALTLKLQPLTPNHDWDKLLAPMFKGRNIFSMNNLAPLGRVLKESAVDDEDSSNANTGSWKPQIHFVWDVIFDRLLPPAGSEIPTQGSFRDFFRIVVDESLFSASSSPERKYWGFQVFKTALARVSVTELPMLFTKNLMRSWINHLSNKDRYLHKISLDVAKNIHSLVQKDPTLGFTLILQLTGVNGSKQFDKLTRTKTVESILTVMDSAGIKSYVLSLLEQVSSNDPDEDDSIVNSRRDWIADQFAALIRNGSVPKSDDWIQIVLDWYTMNGLFVVRKKSENSAIHALRTLPSPSFAESTRHYCRTRLLGCLADMNTQLTTVKQGEQTHRETAVASNGEFWITKVLGTLAQLDKDSKHVSPIEPIEEEQQDLISKVQKLISHLRKSAGEKSEIARGFELLLSSLLLQSRCGEEDSIENSEACLTAASQMFPSEKSSRKSKKAKNEQVADEADPIDVVVDVIIGFLEKGSAYMRSVANESFSRISSAVRESTMDLILNQLERRDPSDLVNNEELGSAHDDDDSDEAVEELEEDNSSEEASGSESDEEEDVEATEEVRQKIANTLKAIDAGDDDDDSENDSDEELMDDDQMMAIDEHLAEIFRSRTSERNSKKGPCFSDLDAQREATHFKNRVLDLVDIFVKKESQNALNIRLVLPLIDLATKSGMDERQLSDKATGILKGRLAKSKEVPSTAHREDVETILREVHKRAQRLQSSDAISVLSQSSLYLCRILVQSNGEDVAVHVYQESLDDYLSRKASQLNSSFFQDWSRRFPSLAWKLKEGILNASSKAVNGYRKSQAFQLLHTILSQPPKVRKASQGTSAASFQKALQKTIIDQIIAAASDETSLTASQAKDLLKVALLRVRQLRKANVTPVVLDAWDPTAWKTLHSRLSSSDRFKSSSSLLDMCRQVESALPLSNPEGRNNEAGKRKVDEVADAEPSKKRSRKKQKSGS
ncbi:DNA polymerase phi-domain-containing protein [Phlebopus sp. FC_14]|nr:DNA polymerase phi-domain-containing protein [Phlebopus sp. FC_14]